jgi:hypothetical protein
MLARQALVGPREPLFGLRCVQWHRGQQAAQPIHHLVAQQRPQGSFVLSAGQARERRSRGPRFSVTDDGDAQIIRSVRTRSRTRCPIGSHAVRRAQPVDWPEVPPGFALDGTLAAHQERQTHDRG